MEKIEIVIISVGITWYYFGKCINRTASTLTGSIVSSAWNTAVFIFMLASWGTLTRYFGILADVTAMKIAITISMYALHRFCRPPEMKATAGQHIASWIMNLCCLFIVYAVWFGGVS